MTLALGRLWRRRRRRRRLRRRRSDRRRHLAAADRRLLRARQGRPARLRGLGEDRQRQRRPARPPGRAEDPRRPVQRRPGRRRLRAADRQGRGRPGGRPVLHPPGGARRPGSPRSTACSSSSRPARRKEVFEQGFKNLFYAAPAVANDHYNYLAEHILALPAGQRPEDGRVRRHGRPVRAGHGVRPEGRSSRPAAVRTVVDEVYPPNTTDFGSIAAKIAASKADMRGGRLAVPGRREPDRRPAAAQLPAQAGRVLHRADQPGVRRRRSATRPRASSRRPATRQKAPYPSNKEFVEKYTAQFGKAPEEDEANAYTTGQVVAAAVKAVGCAEQGECQQKLVDWVRANKVETVVGPLTWDETGKPAGRPHDPAVGRAARSRSCCRPTPRRPTSSTRSRPGESPMPSGALLFQSVILGLLLGGLYALLAAGLTLYFGIMRVVMIAHSAFLILAAYLAWCVHERLGVDPLLSMVVTVPLFFGAGVLLQRLLLAAAAAGHADDDVGAAHVRHRADHRGAARVRVHRHPAAHPARLRLGQHRALRRPDRGGQADRVRPGRGRAARAVPADEEDRRSAGRCGRPSSTGTPPGWSASTPTGSPATGSASGLATAAVGGTALALDTTIYPSLHWHWIGPLMAIIVVGGLGSVPGAAIAAMLLGPDRRACCRSRWAPPGRRPSSTWRCSPRWRSGRRDSSEVALPSVSRAALGRLAVAGRARWPPRCSSFPALAPEPVHPVGRHRGAELRGARPPRGTSSAASPATSRSGTARWPASAATAPACSITKAGLPSFVALFVAALLVAALAVPIGIRGAAGARRLVRHRLDRAGADPAAGVPELGVVHRRLARAGRAAAVPRPAAPRAPPGVLLPVRRAARGSRCWRGG